MHTSAIHTEVYNYAVCGSVRVSLWPLSLPSLLWGCSWSPPPVSVSCPGTVPPHLAARRDSWRGSWLSSPPLSEASSHPLPLETLTYICICTLEWYDLWSPTMPYTIMQVQRSYRRLKFKGQITLEGDWQSTDADLPVWPARAVRPTLWMYCFTVAGIL